MSLAFTGVLLGKLKGNPALMGRITYLGDAPPDNQRSPYIVIGEEQDTPGRILDESETRHFFTLHIWSEYRGRKEIKELIALVRADIESMPDMHMEDAQVIPDSSGWWHGIVSYHTYL